jgi:hypothetical protein
MTFRVDTLRGAVAGVPGQVDYRLARAHAVAEYQRGRLSRLDVCDAHPELLRNAVSLGAPAGQPCPICDGDELVHVTYVFGAKLPPNGRCVSSRDELAKLGRRPGVLAAYVVEVCTACSWNHLARTFLLGRGTTA